jgi:lipopolysaccharide export system permease protein
MNSVLDRYISSEMLKTLAGVAIVLYLIFLSNKLVHFLGEVASGNLPGSYLFIVIGLVSIRYLIILTPLAFYISILLFFGRLYKDHEMASMAACGIGAGRLYRPVFKMAIPLSIFIAILSFYVVPWASDFEASLAKRFARNLEFSGIHPGKFHGSNDRIIYLEAMSDDRTEMRNVFIQAKYKEREILMVAEKAYMEIDAKTDERLLVLVNGSRYEGKPGESEFRQMQFSKHSMRVASSKNTNLTSSVEAQSSLDLLRDDSIAAWVELQWRLAIPLSIILLAFLAVPLSRVKPRQGQFGKLFVGILIYVVYINLIAVSKAWVVSEKIPLYFGLSWVHLLIFILGLSLLLKQYGWYWARQILFKRGAIR